MNPGFRCAASGLLAPKRKYLRAICFFFLSSVSSFSLAAQPEASESSALKTAGGIAVGVTATGLVAYFFADIAREGDNESAATLAFIQLVGSVSGRQPTEPDLRRADDVYRKGFIGLGLYNLLVVPWAVEDGDARARQNTGATLLIGSAMMATYFFGPFTKSTTSSFGELRFSPIVGVNSSSIGLNLSF